MHWQDIHNLEHYWPEQLAILRRLRDLGKKVFGSNWYDKTFWQGLDLIVTDLDNNTLGTMDDVESAYTISVLSRLERGDLLGMEKALLEADKMMGEVLGVESNITPDPNIFNAAWEDHWWLMGIDADGAAMLAKRSARLSQTDFDKLLSHFDQLTVAYDLVSAQMLAVGALLPVFFCYSGLNTALTMVNSASLVLITLAILAASIAAKGVACWAAARLTGQDNATALGIGALMNARGLMELIIINIGLQHNIIERPLFSMFVLMAIVTTLMASPLFELVYGRKARERGELGALSDVDADVPGDRPVESTGAA